MIMMPSLVFLIGFSLLVNAYAHKHSVKLSIVCCTCEAVSFVIAVK